MRIPVVEDEEKVARFIERGLVAERFAVDVADDGVAGLELARTYNYDLMILDLLLPRMEGTEVLRRVRLSNPNIPILILLCSHGRSNNKAGEVPSCRLTKRSRPGEHKLLCRFSSYHDSR